MWQIRKISPKNPTGRAAYFVNMKVSTNQPFQIVYSLFEHEYLGFIFEAFVIQLNSKNELTLQNQSVSTKNIKEFSERLNETDFELVKLIDSIQQDAVVKKFNTRKLSAIDFFLKIYDPEKGDKLLQDTIHGYMEKHRSSILEKLMSKQVFIMGQDGEPTWKKINIIEEGARAYFNFIRNDENTHYFPTIKCGEARVQFQFKNAKILCEEAAWLLVDDKLYHFEKHVDGKKLKPFLNKNHIIIPRNIEDTYYHKFIAPLVAQFDVFAQGFEIKYEKHSQKPILTLTESVNATKKVVVSLFESNEQEEDVIEAESSEIIFDLSFQYGDYTFRFDSFSAEAYVKVEKLNENWLFHKVKRDLRDEKAKVLLLKNLGLDIGNGRKTIPKIEAFSWLQRNATILEENGFETQQQVTTNSDKQYFLGYSSIEVKIEEKNDWFDIKALVRFGDFEIPFLKIRHLILANKKEFELPNGQVAVIPSEWFTRYSELFNFSEKIDTDDLILKKHHLVLVQDLSAEGLAHTIMSRKLENLQNFEQIEQKELPKHFKTVLRPYQKAGFDWIYFLNKYKFGGCLADDMGLGKTVMTLAFLQSLKENGSKIPTLLVMPTSLIYNWEKEAEKFTPRLKIYKYTGSYREKNTEIFDYFDLILTSYGTLRVDIDFIKNYRFNYVILDESQAIKNPSSAISKAVMQLNSSHRLILTGTPLENSTMDLWTQMSFINPGLLGSQAYFRNEYQIPIERHQDEKQSKRLYSMIKPFMLRRHKSQVATELPPKVESIQYCDMTESQEKQYEEAKSYFRNLILEQIENEGINKSQMVLLQGLTKLRQIANHPIMVDGTYNDDSGKFEDVIQRLQTIIEEGHKVLIFSQFVKHLSIFEKYLKSEKIEFCYLDGSTTNRQEQVERFQTDDKYKIFLISLKAGGVGLNLTAAEYVFVLDPWWNPAIEAQAIDRAHRIGQQKTVFTYKFITRNTVEEKILALQQNKKRLFDELITTEENFVKSLSKDDVLVLLS